MVNIGGVEEISVTDLAKRIIDKSSSKSSLSYTPYEQVYTKDFEDMPRRVPSTEKLRNLIGMAPKRTLDSILDDVIEHLRLEAR